MEVKEPEFVYGLPNSQVEELRGRLIELISHLTDVHLLEKCEELLTSKKKDATEEMSCQLTEGLNEVKAHLNGSIDLPLAKNVVF